MMCGNRNIRRGSAVLEAALVLPIILSLSFGGVEFGYYMFVKNTFQGAAREGARAAINAGATNTDVTTAVAGVMTAAGFNSSQYMITTNPATVSSATTGTAVTVSISAQWGTIGVRPLGVIPSTKNVTGSTVMRKEG
jgi:Flp pilus assembly protein TadG